MTTRMNGGVSRRQRSSRGASRSWRIRCRAAGPGPRILADTIDSARRRVESERVSFRARDFDSAAPDREPAPGAVPEPVRRAIDRVASWMQAELGLVMSGVRGLTRDVHGLIADVKSAFGTLSVRLALVETRLAQMEEREPPAAPRESPDRCRRRVRPRRSGGGRCRGAAPDH
jgi:hypothetical protein